MNRRWEIHARGGPTRMRVIIKDALVDENGDYLVAENGFALEAGWATTTKALRDERARVLVDENENALIAL